MVAPALLLLALACGSDPVEPSSTEVPATGTEVSTTAPVESTAPVETTAAAPEAEENPAPAQPEKKFGSRLMEDPSTHRTLEPDPDQSRSTETDIIDARALVDSNRIDEAQALIQRAIAARPEDPDAHFWLGRTFEKQGAFEPAVESMLRATELDPDFASAWWGVGFNYTMQRRCADALAAQTRYIELRPDNPGGYYNRAGCRWYTADREGSLEDGRKACEMGHQVACMHVEKQLKKQEMLDAFEARRAADQAEQKP